MVAIWFDEHLEEQPSFRRHDTFLGSKEVPQWFALSLMIFVAACASVPPKFEDSAELADGSGLVTNGEFLYHDNRDDFFFREVGDSSLDLKATIGKEPPTILNLFSPTHRRLLTRASIVGLGSTETMQWSIEYDFRPTDLYGASDYLVAAEKLPSGFSVAPFSTKGLSTAGRLPILFFEGNWNEKSVRVVATRGFGYADTNFQTENPWSSLLNDYQRFQVLSADGRLLGEIIASGGTVSCRYRFGVSKTVSELDQISMAKFLSSVATLHRFLEATDNYRTGWSPDGRQDPNGHPTMSDWPELW